MVTKLTANAGCFFSIVLLGSLFLPVAMYIINGWVARREKVINYMSLSSFEIYFKTFFPVKSPKLQEEYKKAFEEHYYSRFGRRHYIGPVLLLLAVASFLLVLVQQELFRSAGPRISVPLVAIYALAGAYMWVLADFISRARRLDLNPVDINWGSFRLVIAVPMGFALASLATESIGPAVAFFAAAFPISTLFKISRRLAYRRLGLGEGEPETTSELEHLQSVTTSIAERYTNEGVSTILQMAYCDPVDMTIRSGFSFSFVVDCVSQALAWIYLKDDLEKARRYSLRGAQEIYSLIDEMDDDKPLAKHTLEKLAEELSIDPGVLERTFREIAEDPYTNFICEVWAQA